MILEFTLWSYIIYLLRFIDILSPENEEWDSRNLASFSMMPLLLPGNSKRHKALKKAAQGNSEGRGNAQDICHLSNKVLYVLH